MVWTLHHFRPMNIGDIVVIYLAFGSPLAVYKYLQLSGTDTPVRVGTALATLLIWMPILVWLGYRHMINAYSGTGFVSRRVLDASQRQVAEIRERIKTELIRNSRDLTLYDVGEVLDRYVGLSIVAAEPENTGAASWKEMFDIAESQNPDLAATCLMRRNRRRIERHHTHAREDYISLFENRSTADDATRDRIFTLAIALAERLKDPETVRRLTAIDGQVGEVWNSEEQLLGLSNIQAAITPLSAETIPTTNTD